MENLVALCQTHSKVDADALSELNELLAKVAKLAAAFTSPHAVIGNLSWLCQQVEPELRPRFEQILGDLLKAVKADYSQADSSVIAGICSRPLKELYPMAREHLKDGELEDIHVRLVHVWKPFKEQREREFAQRCSIALVEAVRLHRLVCKEGFKPRLN